MTVTVTTLEGGGVRVAIEGELDVVTVPALRKEVERVVGMTPKRVEVDLHGLRMVDSSGVGALVSLYKQVRGQGGEVMMLGLRDQPLAIFRLLRLDRVMGASLPGPSHSQPTTSSKGG
jgi:anti-sigma B factor antagonist